MQKSPYISSHRLMSIPSNKRSYQDRLSSKIISLSQKLFTKFEFTQDTNLTSLKYFPETVTNHSSQNQDIQYDSLQSLCSRAQQITQSNKNLIESSKRKQKRHNKMGTFLTGTNIYEPKYDTKQNYPQNEDSKNKVSQLELIKNLEEQPEYDDLTEVRKMIEETDKNIGDCRKKVFQTQKSIKEYVNSMECDRLVKKGYLVLSQKSIRRQ